MRGTSWKRLRERSEGRGGGDATPPPPAEPVPVIGDWRAGPAAQHNGAMVRRVHGRADVAPYHGSREHRRAEQARAERERRLRRFVEAALEFADFDAYGAADASARGFAELCAETMASPESTARLLNEAGVARGDGRPWTGGDVVSGISALWPHSRYGDWPRELGTYPGYLGGLRDDLMAVGVPGRLGPRRTQLRCTRCAALWPNGWPGTEEGCPDCGNPGYEAGVDIPQVREHSVIDLHWMLYRYAPADPGPCPACGTRRELVNAGVSPSVIVRPLDWACPGPEAGADKFEREGHYRASLTQAWWGSEAAHHAYWMAVDLLRVAAETGEVTELPPGAVYEALDGSGRSWVHDGASWSLRE